MTKRENILLKILLVIFTCAAFYLSFTYFTDGTVDNIKNAERYTKLTEKVNQARVQAEEERAVLEIINETEKVEEINMSELLELILADLKSCNIRPGRYQISTKGKTEYVDFTLKCSAAQLTNYLAKTNDISYPYTVASTSIKTEEEGLSATIRYELIPEKIMASGIGGQKTAIQKMLRSPYKPPKIVPVKEEKKVEIKEEKKPEEKIIDGNKTYKVIGFIKDSNNINNLFVKTTSGRMIKIPPENILEEDKEKYILRIDENKVKLNK